MLWVQFKLKKFPSLRKIKIAKSYERREIFVLKISEGRKNSAVFLMGGEDGRDWLSPVILINFVDYILEHKLNVDVLTKHYDFYILPIFNPDGYDYSMMKVNILLIYIFRYFTSLDSMKTEIHVIGMVLDKKPKSLFPEKNVLQ